MWSGVSLGISGGLPKSAAIPAKLFDITKLVLDKAALAVSKTEYSLIYGNGRDYNDKLKGHPSISGWHGLSRGKGLFDWHLGINQNNY